jgi:hypothetical protein
MLLAGESGIRFPTKSLRTVELGLTLPLTEMYTRNLCGDKGLQELMDDNLIAIY